jgi:anaerobic selenocysteine-containing dehydrogenase
MADGRDDWSITRRKFLGDSARGAAALGLTSALGTNLLLQGCRPGGTAAVPGACHHDCPDTCAWLTTVEDGKVATFHGDPDHPLTRGKLCDKMTGFPTDVVYNPDRVLHPLRRTGRKGEGRFERTTWDEALGGVARRLEAIVAEHGPTAVLPYSYYGTQGMVQAESIDRRFFAHLGASRLVRAVCGSAGDVGVSATLGTSVGVLPKDIARSRFIIVWGANPVVTNSHAWPFIAEARRNGAQVVVIDPVRTRTAAEADWHVQPLPGTDAALALGMMHVIVRDGLHDADYVERHTLGFDKLRERLAEYPPDLVARITGLDADEIERLAKAYATTRPSTIRTLIGMEHHGNGAMTFRTVACLPALVGAWRDVGGGLLHLTFGLFGDALEFGAAMAGVEEDSSIREINMVQLGRALTDSSLDPPIAALVVYNSNPAIIASDQNRVVRGLSREDLLTVVVEHFVTDTARYADYVFPATTQLEHLDLVPSWGHEYLSLNRPAIEPLGEAVPNTEFFRRLARRMGFEERSLYESDEEIVRGLLGKAHPYMEGITFEQLREDGWARLRLPEPWLPFADGGFPTPAGKCEFYSAGLVEQGVDPLPAYTPVGEQSRAGAYPLMLLTPKSTRLFLNSSHANQPRQLKAEGRPHVELHAADARRRDIADGDLVRVFNDRGEVRLHARVRDGVRRDVVSLPHGWWSSLIPGGSTGNALTPDGLSDLGGGADFHDAWVEVEKVG